MISKTTTLILLCAGALLAGGEATTTDSLAVLKARKAELERALNAATAPVEKSAKTDSAETIIAVKQRTPRTGGAGGITVGFQGFNMTPIRDMIVRREQEERTLLTDDTSSLKIDGLNFTSLISDREIVPTFGGTGYASFDGGVRIGGSFRVSAARFAATRADSLYTLLVGTGWAGILLEKAIYPSPKSAVVLGGHVGAGGTGAVIYGETGNGSGLSGSKKSYDYDGSSGGKTLSGGAPFFLAELHGGATWSVRPWLHLGGEFTTELHHSRRGFNWADGYTSINPGGSVRVIFGRAG